MSKHEYVDNLINHVQQDFADNIIGEVVARVLLLSYILVIDVLDGKTREGPLDIMCREINELLYARVSKDRIPQF